MRYFELAEPSDASIDRFGCERPPHRYGTMRCHGSQHAMDAQKGVHGGLLRAQMPGSLLYEHQPQIPWISAANRDIKGEAVG
jgi:hypothetical protein